MSRSATVKTDNALVRYFKDVRAEVSKVTWPTREEGTRLTAVVMAVTVASALFLFGFDSLFSFVITWLISL